ncbi:MAG: adenylate/guanylate cyclase domain-containing protein [Acidobacteriia bacterium]|nr:adenylate/guanylate cyclase domain-containing protein [Terriglobia bacterium]
MATAKEIRAEVDTIFATRWEKRNGQIVPDSEDVELGNDAVQIEGTVLYADLADSTELVDSYKDYFAAEIYKAYLVAACRIIRDNDGEITAFDGDRVMAVYLGDSKNSNAARSALKINWAVKKVIGPAVKKAYPDTSFNLKQAVGIDTSALFVARTGIRGSNDLVWVGRAANYAAKLSAAKEAGHSSLITEAVFNKLNEKSKYGGEPRRVMWEKVMWREMGITVYGSNWWWEI